MAPTDHSTEPTAGAVAKSQGQHCIKLISPGPRRTMGLVRPRCTKVGGPRSIDRVFRSLGACQIPYLGLLIGHWLAMTFCIVAIHNFMWSSTCQRPHKALAGHVLFPGPREQPPTQTGDLVSNPGPLFSRTTPRFFLPVPVVVQS